MTNNFTTLNIDPANKQTAFILVDSSNDKILDKGIINNLDFIDYVNETDYDIMNIEIVANMGVSGVSLYDTSEMVGILSYITLSRGRRLNRYKRHTVKKLFNAWKKPPSIDSQIRTKLINKYGEVGTKKNQGYFYGFKKDLWQAFAIYEAYKNNCDTEDSFLHSKERVNEN